MRRRTWIVTLLLAGASVALAVKPGGTLFVKGKDVKVLPTADLGATPVMKLQSGDEVTWNGADAKNKQRHMGYFGATGLLSRRTCSGWRRTITSTVRGLGSWAGPAGASWH